MLLSNLSKHPLLPCLLGPQDVFDVDVEEMPVARFRSAAVNVSQHVYLFGGRDTNGSLVSEQTSKGGSSGA